MPRSPCHNLYVNGRFLVQKQTGVQRFAREVVQALDTLLSEPAHADLCGRVSLVAPAGAELPDGLMNMQKVHGGALGHGYMWEQVDLPRISTGGVLLSLCNLGPIAKRRQVVVLHDAATRAMPQAFSRLFRSIYGLMIPVLIRRVAHLATVSEFSRVELSHWFGAPHTRMLVCHEGGEHILAAPADTSVLGRHGLTRASYFLAVGMGPANKNQDLVLRAYAKAGLGEIPLVLTGRRSARVHGAKALEEPVGIVHVGHVPDAELRALYENATALIFPSSYEGFGLPPVEAMACGCPVVISDQPALIEVAGDAGLVVGMSDTEGLAAALRQIAANPALREDLSARGLERVRQFTWRATAEKLLAQCRTA